MIAAATISYAESYYCSCCNYEPEPIPLDYSIWRAWRRGLESLLYLWRAPVITETSRRIIFNRRTDPRWRAGKWKSTT